MTRQTEELKEDPVETLVPPGAIIQTEVLDVLSELDVIHF